MNQSRRFLAFLFGIIIVTGTGSSWYLFPLFDCESRHYQESIEQIQHEIVVFKSLSFSPSSELLKMLENYETELIALNENRGVQAVQVSFEQAKKLTDLIQVTRKMLQSYVQDLQEYTRLGNAPTSTIIQFSYDTVVRLTLALAELEKNRCEGLDSTEYLKKIDRMKEIIHRSIAHSKGTLRTYLQKGLIDADPKIAMERNYLTRKVEDLIAVDKLLYA